MTALALKSPTYGTHMDKILEHLTNALACQDPGMVGCQRRQEWIPGDPPWRWIRGNALLGVVGRKDLIYTPAGPMELYFYSNFLLQYRAGPWNTHWVEDFYDTWSLVKADELEPDDLANTILVFHEDKGLLDIKQVPAPPDWRQRVDRMKEDYKKEPRGRISKATSHAIKVCRFCPVKYACDAHDKLRGEDKDWSPSYPQP